MDKTEFIKEWWENGDAVTLITRPGRFGKTLNMSMLEQFFSLEYANRGDLFQGLAIWEEKLSDREGSPSGESPLGGDYNNKCGYLLEGDSRAKRCWLEKKIVKFL